MAMWKMVGLLGGLLSANNLWSHGPGKPLALTTGWCNASGKQSIGSEMQLNKLLKVRSGDNHSLCLTVRNDEPIALALSLTIVPGQMDECGRRFCRVPLKPERGAAWLLEGGADGRYHLQLSPHEQSQHLFTLRIQTVPTGSPETTSQVTSTGWVGCLLVEGRVALPEQADGHKNTRQLQMIQADLVPEPTEGTSPLGVYSK